MILGKQQFTKRAHFIGTILKKHHAHDVLELGCGTGLYLRPLKKAGFRIEGLDISQQMLKQAKDLGVPLYKQDMSTFSLDKKYDAILCLNSSLVLLPNMRAIAQTVVRCKKHLRDEGLLIIDLPHHEKEIPENDGTVEIIRRKTSRGLLTVKEQMFREKNRWVEIWNGTIGKKKFTERFSELIYSPAAVERILNKNFDITRIYGSRTGGPFTKNSYRRVYVCTMRKESMKGKRTVKIKSSR